MIITDHGALPRSDTTLVSSNLYLHYMHIIVLYM